MNRVLLIPLIPIAGALFLAFFGRRISRLSGWIATAVVFVAFAVAAPIAFGVLSGNESSITAFAWPFIHTSSLQIDIAFTVDKLSALMLFVVLGVGALIHLFSIEYMKNDPGVSRYFAYLNMFIAFMLLLILGDNLFVLFVGWEGVGLSSYCLIGFWYENAPPRRAAIKAFITNRVGDVGFVLGLLLLASRTGTASFTDIAAKVPALSGATFLLLGHEVPLLELTAFLLFLGACGKSAQFPLHVWLPDAMEGPTPVSALIHAATMVTAGVYMVARLQTVFAGAPVVRELMLAVAVLTALAAAVAAMAQTDLKRILAYSTISQLGYMMAGVSVGAREAALFHLATHAVFKALLFLSAGSIMHALSGELDIRKMGGLWNRIPASSIMLIVGALGLAGIPLFAGFYSKDMVIASVAHEHPMAAGLLIVGALLTAFYSARMVAVALFGHSRLDSHVSEHCHESGLIILIPLAVLALTTLGMGLARQAGVFPLPELLGLVHEPSTWVVVMSEGPSGVTAREVHERHSTWVVVMSVLAAFGGSIGGMVYYRNRVPSASPWSEFAKSGFRIDALYEKIFIVPVKELAKWSTNIVDTVGIDSIATGFAEFAKATAESMRLFQTGNLGTYLCYMAGGLAILLWAIS